jgi:hypothetical protein
VKVKVNQGKEAADPRRTCVDPTREGFPPPHPFFSHFLYKCILYILFIHTYKRTCHLVITHPQAEVLAYRSLRRDRGRVSAGQAYFISDGRPINNFEFFRPILEGLGYRQPTLRVPTWLMLKIALYIEVAFRLLGR